MSSQTAIDALDVVLHKASTELIDEARRDNHVELTEDQAKGAANIPDDVESQMGDGARTLMRRNQEILAELEEVRRTFAANPEASLRRPRKDGAGAGKQLPGGVVSHIRDVLH